MFGSRFNGMTVISIAVIVLGIAVVATTMSMPVSPAYAKVGPSMFPYAIGGALIVMGFLLLREATPSRWACEATDPETATPDMYPLLWVGSGLLANLLLIKPLGFILSSTIMYVLIARGFGSRRLWLAAIVGFVLTLVAYVGFARLLGLRMGGGLIEGLL